MISEITGKLISNEAAYVTGISKAALEFNKLKVNVNGGLKAHFEEYLEENTFEKLNQSISNYEKLIKEVYNFTYYYTGILSKEDRLLISNNLKEINDTLFMGRTTSKVSSDSLSVYNIYTHPDNMFSKYESIQLVELLDEFNLKIEKFQDQLADLEEQYKRKME